MLMAIPVGKPLVLNRSTVKRLLRYGKLQRMAREWLAQEDRRAKERKVRKERAASQPPLPLPTGELRPSDTVSCRLPKTTLPVHACLTRRSRVLPSGGGSGAAEFPECVGCGFGEDYERRCPTFTPPPSTSAPEVLPSGQRMARRARQLVGLEDGETVRVDPLREAATLSPDDDSDWRA